MSARGLTVGRRPRRLLRLAAGFLVWASCLLLLYAAQFLGCGAGLQARASGPLDGVTALLAAICLAHAGLLAAMAAGAVRRCRRDGGAALPWGAIALLDLGALAGTLWIGLPVLVLPPCA